MVGEFPKRIALKVVVSVLILASQTLLVGAPMQLMNVANDGAFLLGIAGVGLISCAALWALYALWRREW